ncbi:MAG: dTMP kinase [Acidobacteria bacterium]|nr:dTMP kinase [Acidobacteriota bacterium]
MRGRFITFEGADGCGKTTQLRRAVDRLRALGVDVVATREPGGSSAGAEIRSLVLDRRERPIVPVAELLLIEADRAQHVVETIRPAIERGALVICDRFTDATVAYQGGGRGLDPALIGTLNLIATGGLEPDMTLVFDVDVSEAMRRLDRRAAESGGEAATRFDLEHAGFHDRVRRAYLDIAGKSPGRVRVIDANRPIEVVAADVDRFVEELRCRCAI